MLVPSILFPYSDQTTTERILKENKDFVEFINVSVTNFAEGKKEDFRKIYEKHFNADIAYLQSDYKRAFKRVYSSQGDMEKLYRDMVKEYYLEDSKVDPRPSRAGYNPVEEFPGAALPDPRVP